MIEEGFGDYRSPFSRRLVEFSHKEVAAPIHLGKISLFVGYLVGTTEFNQSNIIVYLFMLVFG